MITKTWFFLVSIHIGTVFALCPNGWTRFMDSCYLFPHEASTFTEAENYCLQHKSHLVHVNSAVETAFLRGVLQELKRPKHWIGLTDRDIEGVWAWIDDDGSPAYTDWYPNEPNQGIYANCACIREDFSYKWTDDGCSETYYPICEKGTDVLTIVPVG